MIKLGVTISKASTLLTVLWLQPQEKRFYKVDRILALSSLLVVIEEKVREIPPQNIPSGIIIETLIFKACN